MTDVRTRIQVKDGRVTIVREQETAPILADLAASRTDNPSGYAGKERVFRRKGMIPNVVLERMIRERMGLDFVRAGAKERQAAMLEMMTRALDDPDYKDFRTTERAPTGARGLSGQVAAWRDRNS